MCVYNNFAVRTDISVLTAKLLFSSNICYIPCHTWCKTGLTVPAKFKSKADMLK